MPSYNESLVSELSTILKTVYGAAIENQQNLTFMLYKKFSQSTIKFGGNHYEFPARMGNAQSIGARGYREALPAPLANIDVTTRVRHRFLYGTFDITGPDIEKGKTDADAFANLLTDKMRSLTEMVMKDMAMQTYLDGTGIRATVTGVTQGQQWVSVSTVKYLRVGMHINFVYTSAGNPALRGGTLGESDAGDTGAYQNKRFRIGGIQVTGAGTPQIYVTVNGTPFTNWTGAGVVSGDYVVRHKSVGGELVGIGAIIDDGVNNAAANILQEINRTDYPLWRARVINAAGTLTTQLLQRACDIPEIISGKKIDLIVGSYNARDQFLAGLLTLRRFTDPKLQSGFSELEFNGREFLVDTDCQDDTVYIINKDSIQRFGLFDLKFVDQGGGVLKHDSLSSGDVFYGYLRAICNFGTMQPNACSKVIGITVSNDYKIAV